MKHLIKLGFPTLLTLALTASISNPCHAVNYESNNGFTMPTDAVLPSTETHPSLWFNKSGIAAQRDKKNADEYAAKLWKDVVESPFAVMGVPELFEDGADKKTVHQYYGNMSQFAMYNAFLGLVSEDKTTAARFRERAIAALLRAYDGPLYEIDPLKSSSAADEIYRGTWAQSYAAAYDWMQPYVTPEQDRAIRGLFIKEMRYIHENLYKWSSRPHNHLSKPAWGLGSMALALADHDESHDWLTRAIQASNDNTSYCFTKDGIYREGAQYYIFSFINFLPFLYHYRNVSGVDAFDVFQPAFEWPVLVRNSRGWLPNHEDSYIRPYPSQMVMGAYKGKETRLSDDGDLAGVLRWNFENTDHETFDESLETSGFNYTGASWDFPLELVRYLTYEPGIEAVEPHVSPTVFMDGGQTAFRNEWAASPKGQRYLLFQGVAEMDNHDHTEHLSFIIQGEGQMMASDSGYSRSSYGEAIRTSWYITPEAHNIVMVNGEAPGDFVENWTPPSRDRTDTTFFDFEEKTAAYPSGGIHSRGIAFPQQEYFVVSDRIDIPESGEATFVLHGGRATMTGDSNQRTWTYENDSYGPPAKMAAWILPANSKFENKTGEVTYIKGDYAEYPYVTASQVGSLPGFLTVITPGAIDAAAPKVTDASTDLYRAARIVLNDGSADFIMNQANAFPVSTPEFSTDAVFAWHTADGRAFFQRSKATDLKTGLSVYSSMPITVAIDPTGNKLQLWINAEFASHVSVQGTGATSAQLDGETLPLEPVGNSVRFSLPGAGRFHVEFTQ